MMDWLSGKKRRPSRVNRRRRKLSISLPDSSSSSCNERLPLERIHYDRLFSICTQRFQSHSRFFFLNDNGANFDALLLSYITITTVMGFSKQQVVRGQKPFDYNSIDGPRRLFSIHRLAGRHFCVPHIESRPPSLGLYGVIFFSKWIPWKKKEILHAAFPTHRERRNVQRKA